MSIINILSEETINQIAAGEVIEHPASVVKELVENSLDAGAKAITIEVAAGGFHLIRVSDNGSGMTQEDAKLSLHRHATSKICKAEDLFSISSMGFRGEALASIASISKLTMITALANKTGVKLVCEAGQIKEVSPFARERGTTIEVRALFYTTPARKKFQKSPSQALSDIHKMLTSLALAREDVSFELLSEEKTVFKVAASSFAKRVEALIGEDLFKDMLPIEEKGEIVKLQGWVSQPHVHRPNRLGQHLFVNLRAITAPSISFAITHGYGVMLPVKRHPLFVVRMTLVGSFVDVNVHPQKKEVRFKEEERIKYSVKRAVEKTLRHIPIAEPQLVENTPTFSMEEFFSKKQQNSLDPYSYNSYQISESKPIEKQVSFLETPTLFPKLQDINPLGIYKQALLLDARQVESILAPPYYSRPYEGLFMLDLRGALRRIYFDTVMKGEMTEALQSLLFPITLRFTSSEALLLEECLEELLGIGIEIRKIGTQVFIVEALSAHLDEEKIKDLLQELLEDLQKRTLLKEHMKEAFAKKSAKIISIKRAGYDLIEAKLIVNDLLKTHQPYYSPDGHKIIAYLTQERYEELFKGSNS